MIPEKYRVTDLAAALERRAFPTVTLWNRLEGRPRRDDFDRALKAEVRDACWMLARQWQVGEFAAEDAGSPVFAKVMLRSAPVASYRAGDGELESFDASVPLEAKVEQRRIPWRLNGQKQLLDLRAQLGRYWGKLLTAAGLGTYIPKYRTQYPFELPPHDASGADVFAHRRAWQALAALTGRAVDGGELYVHLTQDAGARASDGIGAGGDALALDALGTELLAWFARQYLVPSADQAWRPEYLEYHFECRTQQAGSPVTLAAEEFGGGHLDWHSFERAPTPADNPLPPPAEQLQVKSFIPTPVKFEGMPDVRWWALEDGKTDFGAVKPSTTDVAQLLLMEFGLVYANDWFLVPFEFPAGTLARVEGLAVTNNFGERFWVAPAGAGLEDQWHRWAMFALTNSAAAAADTSLFIPPATARTLDGEPLEEVELARDEVANMVWAIERGVPSVTGTRRSGKDEAYETRRYQELLIAATNPPPPDYVAPIAYLAMTSVPEHWIPFVAVHVPGSVREIQLQRSRMLRIIDGAPLPPPKIAPRTSLVRTGLDEPPLPDGTPSPKKAYFLHEEEVPREGALVSQGFRRTRWTGGQAVVWLGAKKRTGRGESSSGLAFDAIVKAPARPA